MLNAIATEIKNAVFKSFFHFVRFGGLFLIPFVYGFSYIFAFYDPFKNAEKLPVAIITQSMSDKGQSDVDGNLYNSDSIDITNALAEVFAKEAKLDIGELPMTVKPEHIYMSGKDLVDKAKINEVDNKYNAAIILNPLTKEQTDELKQIKTELIKGSLFDKVIAMTHIKTFIDSFAQTGANSLATIRNNYKKNYLIGFGLNLGKQMLGGAAYLSKTVVESMQNDAMLRALGVQEGDMDTALANAKSLEISGIADLKPVKLYSQMGGDKAKYGYGLAPFFISVAMWIGGMVMTFSVHKKIYNKDVSPTKRYLAKWIVITMGTIIQASILMVALYLIGFNQLGIKHWGSMYGFAIVIGMVFSSVIQAIRFLVPNRNLGIFIIIILLVLQMASGGGLYPIETQSSFYKVLNKILPMGHSVTVLRETAFDTNWSHLLTEFGYLSIYLFIVPFALWANHYQTTSLYQLKGWPLQSGMKAHKRLGGMHD